ncbi:RseA family anti-sigma factor [Lysobacter sp. CA196]|uniref:sigma-E factor negative regulatory protein n=1 Tax=Lysobacter sp. CA196 TaxID=3455606 RepID=UPI003F8D6E91
MTSTTLHGDDRENLSALFDGELDGDAARFALKRLGHDVQWRDTCGRWQLCGDVLRGKVSGAAGHDFAGRVAAAVAAEAAMLRSQEASLAKADAGITPRRAGGSRRGWIGGALAASVAVAALFVARPFSDDTTGVATDPAQVAAQSAPASQVPMPVPAPVEQALAALAAVPAQSDPTQPEAALTSGDASVLAGAVAVAEIPRRLAERRSRGQSQRAALRASERSAEAPVQVAAVANASPLPADTAHANPFRPQPSESATARPWPRAVLPNYSGGSSYTAGYGSSGGGASQSFYPFEPATQAEEAKARSQATQRPQPQP